MSVPRYPNETTAEPKKPSVEMVTALATQRDTLARAEDWDAEMDRAADFEAGEDEQTPRPVNEPIHPVDAFVNAAEQWYPGKPISEELLAQARVWCDTPVCSTCGGAGEIDQRLGGIATSGIVPCPNCSAPPAVSTIDAVIERSAQLGVQTSQATIDKLHAIFADQPADVVPEAQDAINEMVENGWLPDALARHLRLLGPELELWATKTGFPRHSGLFMLSAATVIENLIRSEADLEAKLDAERTLRAQASAELEREKSRERERRIEADGRSRDLLWALDAAIEALVPLAGYATEEDGRVSGMTAPVCLAMSSVRRADALVKLHRALRR